MFFFPKIVLSLHAHSGMFFAFLVYDQKGEMAEWSIAAVLKTVEVQASGGSNPSLSAIKGVNQVVTRFTPFITPRNTIGLNLFVNRFYNPNSYSIQSQLFQKFVMFF